MSKIRSIDIILGAAIITIMKTVRLKIALLVALFFTLPSSVVYAQALNQSALNLELVIPEKLDFGSRFELGDWSSSGAPDFPYEPEYDFSYICQIQLTNGLYYNSSGEPVNKWTERAEVYSLYAISNIRFNKRVTAISTDNLKWKTVKFYHNDKIENTSRRAEVQLKGHRLSLSFVAGETTKKDSVVLAMSVTQPIGILNVSADARTIESRRSLEFTSYVSTSIRSSQTEFMPNYQLRAVCRLEK